ncbi:MAG: Flp family type IVb pilin [Bacillota bacterium]|nr:Flp family type IVb pilin [Bacillota bacterium]
MLKKFFKDIKSEDGQGMVEYGLIIALIAIVVIAALIILGPKIANMFNTTSNNIPA